MTRVASIVEGHGEVQALPVLLRRFNAWLPGGPYVDPLPPIRVSRDRFLNKEDDFRSKLMLAAARSGMDGWVLIVLDADDDCPAQLAHDILGRARRYVGDRKLSVVLAKREFEAWFIAAAHSLDGYRRFEMREDRLMDAERPRDAKGWMREHMSGDTYREVLDQPAFASRFDLQQAFDNSRSFRKLCKEWRVHIQALG